MSVAYVYLSSTPLSLRQIFEQYFQLWARIRRHYLAPRVMLRLLTGRFVPPLGRNEMYGLQYSALPRERATIGEVWNCLSEMHPTGSGTGRSSTALHKESVGVYGNTLGRGWK